MTFIFAMASGVPALDATSDAALDGAVAGVAGAEHTEAVAVEDETATEDEAVPVA